MIINRKLLIASLAAIALSLPVASFASDKVSSPTVKKGKLETEYRSGYDFDDLDSNDGKQAHKFNINYGITDRLRPEIKVDLIDEHDKSLKVELWETSLRYQFFKPEEAYVAAALAVKYKSVVAKNKADRLELTLLASKDYDNWVHILNIGPEMEVGENSKDGLKLKTAWKTNYKFSPYFMPGFEIFSDTGNFRDDLSYNEQKYQFGPNISGKITDDLKYDIGYLFGISEAATDGRLKFIISYTKQF